jgi:septal ring factor EnvC (AmiA/AmiB activator)
MVTIEQIRLLDKKVHSAVERISLLKKENQSLKSKLGDYENRISELERLIETFKQDQGEIEQGISNALDELNRLEDDLDEQPTVEQPSTEDSGDAQSPAPSPSIVQTEEDSEKPSEDSSEEDDDSRTGELDIF